MEVRLGKRDIQIDMRKIGILILLGLHCNLCSIVSASEKSSQRVQDQTEFEQAKNAADTGKLLEIEEEKLKIEERPRAAAICFLTPRNVIQQTLQNQWSIQFSEQQTLVQAGLLQQAAGVFDTQLNSSFSK